RIDGRGGGAVIDKGEPSGVAMSEDIHGALWTPRGCLLYEAEAVTANGGAALSIFVGDALGRVPSGLSAARVDGAELALHRPRQVHRRGPGGHELIREVLQFRRRCGFAARQYHPVGSGGANAAGAADRHVTNCGSDVRHGAEIRQLEGPRQTALVD